MGDIELGPCTQTCAGGLEGPYTRCPHQAEFLCAQWSGDDRKSPMCSYHATKIFSDDRVLVDPARAAAQRQRIIEIVQGEFIKRAVELLKKAGSVSEFL